MATLREQLAALQLDLDAATEARLLRFLDELLRWNRTHNLTALREREEGIEKHLVDSLTLLPLLRGGERLLDLGSGGGFPSLPLKLARPGLRVVSVDSVAKKIHFQRHAARLFGLRDFEPLAARVETLAGDSRYRNGFEVVVARAFTALEGLVRLAAPLLQPGGRLIAMKGPEGEGELAAAGAVLAACGLRWRQTVVLTLPRSGAGRRLIVLEKDGGSQDLVVVD